MPATREYVDRVLEMMAEAAKANYKTPGRQGVTVTLDSKSGDDVMVAGDLHGHRSNFVALCRLAALADHPGRHLVLQEVCHGGPAYDNGGDQSHQMLEDVARLKTRFPDRFHFIMGNHELAELTSYPIMKSGQLLNFVFRLGLEAAYAEAAPRVEEAYHAFIRSLPAAVRTPQSILICHSSPEADELPRFEPSSLEREYDSADLARDGSIFDLTWGRDHAETTARDFAKLMGAGVMIHGHEPCDKGFAVPNEYQIILDCSRRPACYLTFPLKGDLTQKDLVDRIETI